MFSRKKKANLRVPCEQEMSLKVEAACLEPYNKWQKGVSNSSLCASMTAPPMCDVDYTSLQVVDRLPQVAEFFLEKHRRGLIEQTHFLASATFCGYLLVTLIVLV